MIIASTRFGQIAAKQEEIIVFPQGLIGFEMSRNWLVLPDPANPDVAWLQSVSQPQTALPLISPKKFLPDYKVSISNRQLAVLHVRSLDQIYVLTVVSKSGKTLTTNLRSPIIINLTQRLACQVVTNDNQPIALPLSSTAYSALRMAA